ncbi:hypothetical protein D3C85_1533350 [compost metagenome]
MPMDFQALRICRSTVHQDKEDSEFWPFCQKPPLPHHPKSPQQFPYRNNPVQEQSVYDHQKPSGKERGKQALAHR